MDRETIKRIIKNTIIAKEGWNKFCSDTKNIELFETYFHLRPTSQGITIVSTLPYAAMRGKRVTRDNLLDELNALYDSLTQLLSEDVDKAKNILAEKHKYKERRNESFKEEDIQALIIQGMIKNEPKYEEIQFLASELTFEKNNRFDIVGVKNDTLYIFELKKQRETAVIEQIKGYMRHIKENQEAFIEVLQSYPRISIKQINEVKGIIIMPWAANSKIEEALVNEKDIKVWFFENTYGFPVWIS